jgi:hypothetical protein
VTKGWPGRVRLIWEKLPCLKRILDNLKAVFFLESVSHASGEIMALPCSRAEKRDAEIWAAENVSIFTGLRPLTCCAWLNLVGFAFNALQVFNRLFRNSIRRHFIGEKALTASGKN